MTPRQQLALDHACALAEEATNPRFHEVVFHYQKRWSTILTVNK